MPAGQQPHHLSGAPREPPESGPSQPRSTIAPQQFATIPPFGPKFFEYRRRLFLANQPLPLAPTSGHLPSTYRISLPLPDPAPDLPNDPTSSTSVGRLEAMLAEEGAEETIDAWKAGLAGVHQRLEAGKRLSKPLKLGLVIKVLKAGWIRDGTWPMDAKTARAAKPPASPFMDATALPPSFEPDPLESWEPIVNPVNDRKRARNGDHRVLHVSEDARIQRERDGNEARSTSPSPDQVMNGDGDMRNGRREARRGASDHLSSEHDLLAEDHG